MNTEYGVVVCLYYIIGDYSIITYLYIFVYDLFANSYVSISFQVIVQLRNFIYKLTLDIKNNYKAIQRNSTL